MVALMAATLASTITALEGSVTRPVREAFVDWARRAEVNEARESSRRAVIALLGSVGLHPEPEAIAVAPIFCCPLSKHIRGFAPAPLLYEMHGECQL